MTRRSRAGPAHAGLTLVELLFVSAITAIAVAISIPQLLAGVDDMRTSAAARYVAAELHNTRSLAVRRSTRVAFRFQVDGAGYRFGTFADGNRNGVRTADIAAGTDRRIGDDVKLSALFGGVRFGFHPGVPLIDGGVSSDPIRLSSGSLLTFSPDGTATSGTLYICGRRDTQYAVRIFGVTGRTRVYRFMRQGGGWKPL